MSFEGKHFSARGITAHPRPVSSPHPPIWIGGNTGASRQRVAQYGDGWCPFPAPPQLAQTAGTAVIDSVQTLTDGDRRSAAHAATRRAGIGRRSTSPSPTSTAAARQATTSTPTLTSTGLEKLAKLGVTWVSVHLPGDSMAHALDDPRAFPYSRDRRGLVGWTSMDFSRRTQRRGPGLSSMRPGRSSPKHVTDEVLHRDREFGENFNEQVHLALGEAGYLASDWKLESEGGFSPVRRRIFDLEIGRAHTPWYPLGHHVGRRAAGAAIRRAEARRRGPAGRAVRRDSALPGIYRARGRLGRRHLQDPGGARRR